MSVSNGRARVIITNVSPQVGEGQFPAKAIVQEELPVSADIFSDGHDELGAAVFVRHDGEEEWLQIPLTFLNNDHWEAMVPLPELGFYELQLRGWIDHFATWQKGLQKKFEAGQDIKVELLIGADMLEGAAKTAPEGDQTRMMQWVTTLREPQSIDDAVSLAVSNEVTALMNKHADRSLATVYPKTLLVEAERLKAGFSTWYELFPRSASPVPGTHGTFRDVIKLLPRVAGMGFDVLYFPPIHPIGELKRKGRNNSLTAGPTDPGSPWAIGNRLGGHKDIHPELGTLEDFKALIAAAKDHGIEIAMDIAYQCAPDHPWVKEHPKWFKWRPDGTVQYAENPPKKYEDILPINFETEDWRNLWEELKGVIDYWIEQGIDIFRIDNPHTKAFPFWEWMIPAVRKEHPQVIFLAEAFTRPRLMERLGKGGFNQSYSYFTWRNTKAELEEYMTELTKTDMRYFYRPNFWPNTPDILPPELTSGGDNKHIIRLILAATMSSNYGLYGPVYEYGMNTPQIGKEEYIDNEKYEIKHWNWDEYTRIGELIARVNWIRKENKALQTTWNIVFAETTNDEIICYCKRDPKTGNTLIIAVSLDPFQPQSASVKLPLHELGLDSDRPFGVHDLLSGDRYTWQGEWNYVALNPYDIPAHIFRVEQ